MSPDRSTHNPEQDAFNAMLDHALRARSQADPRAGFHLRVARALQQHEQSRSGGFGWWRPLSLVLGAAAAIAAVVIVPGLLHHAPAMKTTLSASLSGNAPDASPAATAKGLTVDRAHTARADAAGLPKRRDFAPALKATSNHARPHVEADAETLPKLDTFPSATTHVDRPFGSSEPLAPMSAEAARAMLDLQRQQARPIVLTAINLNAPLFGEKP